MSFNKVSREELQKRLSPKSAEEWCEWFKYNTMYYGNDDDGEPRTVGETIAKCFTGFTAYGNLSETKYGMMLAQTIYQLVRGTSYLNHYNFEYIPELNSYKQKWFHYYYHTHLNTPPLKGNYSYGTSPNTAWLWFERPFEIGYGYADYSCGEQTNLLVDKELVFTDILIGLLMFYNQWCKNVGKENVFKMLENFHTLGDDCDFSIFYL